VGIVQLIEEGQYDPYLEDMRRAIAERRDVLGQRKLHRELAYGDVVKFVNLGMGAKYLNGIRARIVEINRKTMWVEVLPEDRQLIAGTRFGRSRRIRVYPNSVELVHFDGVGIEAPAKLKNLDNLFPHRVTKNVTPESVDALMQELIEATK